MSKDFLYLGCALGALIAAPVQAQTTSGSTPTQQATTTPPADASTSVSPSNASTAATQDDQGDQATDANGKTKARVEERDVVVTGNRFQKLLDQPQSKSIINAEDRNLAGVGDVRQLVQVTPGFNYTDAYGLSVRGVGRQTAQTLLGAENTVTEYVDGFLEQVPGNIAEDTLFGGNVQFIRGPAGTLYGRNSLAGSVNLLSRSPTKEFTGEALVGTGRADNYRVGANIAGPITSNLGFRLGIEEFLSGSIQKNLSGATLDSKHPGGAGNAIYIESQLEWRVGNFHVRNRLTTYEFDNQPGYATIGAYNNGLTASGTPAAAQGGLAPNPAFGYAGPTPTKPYEINVNYAGFDRLRNNIAEIFNADLGLGNLGSLIYVAGYIQYRAYGSSDYDGQPRTSYVVGATPTPPYYAGTTPGPYALGTVIPTDYRGNYDNANHYWTQEVRLESKAGGPLSWVVGGYYYNQDYNEQYWISINNADDSILTPINGGTGLYPAGTAAPRNPRRQYYAQQNLFEVRSEALFGNATWDLTPHIRFDGGLRYTWDEKQAHNRFVYIYYQPGFAGDYSPNPNGADPFRHDKGLSGRAALAWRPSAGDQLYLSYQRGYQASAFTLGQGLVGPNPNQPRNIANQEHLDVFELGGFATVGRLRFDGSVYYQEFYNQQIPISTRTATVINGVAGLSPVFTQFVNAPRSQIYGAEAQLTWRPNDVSNIVASYTYLHPTFTRFSGVVDISENCAPGGVSATTGLCATNPLYNVPQNLAGNEIPRTPRNKASIFGYYGIDLGSYGHLFPGGNVSYQSSYYTSAFNVSRFKVPGRTIAALTLTYRSPGEHLDITGAVTNVFKTIYFDDITATAFGSNVTQAVGTYGQDRYWTVTARYRF